MFSRAYRAAITVPPLLWVAVFLLVPYALLFCYSFWSVSSSQAIVHSWTLDNYRQLFQVNVYLADSVSLDVDRGAGDDLLSAARLSAGLLPFVLRGQEKRSALSTGHHSAVGQLSGARLCLEDDPGQRWRPQHAAAVCAPDQTSAGISAVQPVRRGADAHAHLHAIRVPADLRVARTHSAKPGRSVARSGRVALSDFLASDLSAFHSRSSGGSDLRIRAQPGRFSGAAAAGRPQRHHDFEYRGQPVRRGLQLAAGRSDFVLHAGAGARLCSFSPKVWRRNGASDEPQNATAAASFALAALARHYRLRFSLPAHRHSDRLLVQRFGRRRISAARPDPELVSPAFCR